MNALDSSIALTLGAIVGGGSGGALLIVLGVVLIGLGAQRKIARGPKFGDGLAVAGFFVIFLASVVWILAVIFTVVGIIHFVGAITSS